MVTTGLGKRLLWWQTGADDDGAVSRLQSDVSLGSWQKKQRESSPQVNGLNRGSRVG